VAHRDSIKLKVITNIHRINLKVNKHKPESQNNQIKQKGSIFDFNSMVASQYTLQNIKQKITMNKATIIEIKKHNEKKKT